MTAFALGRLVATRGVLALIDEGKPLSIWPLIARHARNDWGDLTADDLRANAEALRDGGRLFSSYEIPQVGKVWVITEADRSVTTVLLPDEY